VLAARTFLAEATVDDVVVVFLAGHGVLLGDDYYFLPADFDPDDIPRTALAYQEIEGLLEAIPARQKLLLVDSCHAGEADAAGPDDLAPGVKVATRFGARSFRLQKKGAPRPPPPSQRRLITTSLLSDLFADLRRGSGSVVIGASGAAEFALESADWSNGVFTFSLLEALRDRAGDADHDGKVEVSEILGHVTRRVVELTGGRQTPTARRENLELDFAIY
jgi:uncharacterized caspase-like protein